MVFLTENGNWRDPYNDEKWQPYHIQGCPQTCQPSSMCYGEAPGSCTAGVRTMLR